MYIIFNVIQPKKIGQSPVKEFLPTNLSSFLRNEERLVVPFY